MLSNGANHNLLNAQVGGTPMYSAYTDGNRQKISINKYYNPVTQRIEEVILPEVDLEVNHLIKSETTKFSRST